MTNNMKIKLLPSLLLVSLTVACGNLPFAGNSGNSGSNTTIANAGRKQIDSNSEDTNVAKAEGITEVNYLAYASGTTIVEVPKDWEKAYYTYTTYNLIDESAKSSWESQAGAQYTVDQVFVFELAEKTLLNKFSFDSAYVSDSERPAKNYSPTHCSRRTWRRSGQSAWPRQKLSRRAGQTS